MKVNKTIDKLNNIFLEVKKEIGNVQSLANLDKYEENKKIILRQLEGIRCVTSEEIVLKDKIKIYYRFCDNTIIDELRKGKSYRFIK